MKTLINRFRRWNKWRKGSLNHPFYKFLVLIGVMHSPTFSYFDVIEDKQLAYPDLIIKYREDKPDAG